MSKYRFLLTLFVCIFFASAFPNVSFATDTGAGTVTEAATGESEEEKSGTSGSWVIDFWNKTVGKVGEFFSGPKAEDKGSIDDITELDPYDILTDISYGNDKGTREVKAVSASFYHFIRAVSTVGLIISLIGGGIAVAWSRNRKNEVEMNILSKVLVFTIVFVIADLYGILVPIFKMLLE